MNILHRMDSWSHRGQEKALDTQELELEMVVSSHVDAGTWTQVPGKVASALNC